MIGAKYTPDMLATLAKVPHLRSMEIPMSPDGGECTTTLFNVVDAELASTKVDFDKITSFFYDETSDEPWLTIVEPVE